MVIEILHASQWCHRYKFRVGERFFDGLMHLLCAADIRGCSDIHPSVSFSHGAHGVIMNKDAIVGEKCIIGAKVTLGNAFPHGGAPKLGKHVYVGVGTFIGGDVQVADYVVIGANSVLTKDVLEPGVIVAGVPTKVIRKLTEEEKKMLEW